MPIPVRCAILHSRRVYLSFARVRLGPFPCQTAPSWSEGLREYACLLQFFVRHELTSCLPSVTMYLDRKPFAVIILRGTNTVLSRRCHSHLPGSFQVSSFWRIVASEYWKALTEPLRIRKPTVKVAQLIGRETLSCGLRPESSGVHHFMTFRPRGCTASGRAIPACPKLDRVRSDHGFGRRLVGPCLSFQTSA